MRTRITSLAAATTAGIALALTASACGSVEREVARDVRVDADLAAVTASGVPGATIVIHDRGSTSRVASGVAEMATNTPIKVDDRFRIGSLSKTYVAAVLLQLDEEDKLSLDDRIDRWVPGLIPNGAEITVRQLLNHSSGIANYEEHPSYLAPYMAGDVAHVTTPEQLVAMGNEQGSRFAPGTSSAYSNTNYTVAGLIIEKATGDSLGEQLDQRIFRPLKLNATYLPTTAEGDARQAHGYFGMGGPTPTDVTRFSPSIGWAGGGIISTTEDVTRFYGALLGGRVLSDESLKQMMTTVPSDYGTAYGLGLARRELPCGSVWGHGGNFPGYLVETYSSADGKHQFTAAFNLDPNSMSKASKDAINRLTADAYCGV